MAQNDSELEAKYWVNALDLLQTRLVHAGAQLIQPRVFERNLRFDTADGGLRAAGRVLRLRQDTEARLTFKGPGQVADGLQLRQEIEFSVGDFEAARRLLAALDYVLVMSYEKYRTVYRLDDALIMLDELPYGAFVEIEAGDAPQIKRLSAALGLAWDERVLESYVALFERMQSYGLTAARNLSFDEVQPDARILRTLGYNPAA